MMEKKHKRFKATVNTHLLNTESNERISFLLYSDSKIPITVADAAGDLAVFIEDHPFIRSMYNFGKYSGEFFRTNTITDFHIQPYDPAYDEQEEK